MADAGLDGILGNVVQAVNLLEACPDFALLIPEVRVNLVYAPPGAKKPAEVVGVEGRITAVHGLPRASGFPAPGASDHMARLIIEVRKYERAINAGINFKHDATLADIVKSYCAEKGLRFGWIDRSGEPKAIAEVDRSSMPWKIRQLYESSGGIPRLFYESEGWGKEPLFCALGADAVEVVSIAIEIARLYRLKINKKTAR